jgi:hypothetical protein
MTKPFEYIELLADGSFNEHTSNLSVTVNSTPKVILLRGLVGSLKIRHKFTQYEFDQTIDYFDIGNVNGGVDPVERLRLYLAQELSDEDLGKIFKDRKFLHQNHNFFQSLTNEFSNFYYYENKQSHTTAFAYLYRILETISYAFPLIYASKTDDFIGTYNYLKDFLAGNRDKGELGFFKSFVKVIFEGDPLSEAEASISIDIVVDREDVQEREKLQRVFFNSFRKACPDNNIYSADTEEPRKISVKFSEYSSFIINLRNRFFHLFSSGQPNLQSDDIIDADYFFKLVNRPTTYWISLVLLEILKHSIEKVDEDAEE